jgi:hypothetical protein
MTTHTIQRRDRSAILADIAKVKETVAGTLTAKTRKLASGGTATYHQVQHWDRKAKRNVTLHVPPGKLAEVKAAIGNNKRMEALVAELAAADAAAILAGGAGDPLKKKRKR